METTRLTNRWPVGKSRFDELLIDRLGPFMVDYIKSFQVLEDEVKAICKEKGSIKILLKNCYVNLKNKCVVPDFQTWEPKRIESISDFDFDGFFENVSLIDNCKSELPTLKQLRSMRRILKEFFVQDMFFACICDDRIYQKYFGIECAYNPHTDVVTMKSAVDLQTQIIVFPVCNLVAAAPMDLLMYSFVPLMIYPDGLSHEAMDLLGDLCALNQSKYNYADYVSDGKIKIAGWILLSDFMKNPDEPLFQSLHWKVPEIYQEYYEKRYIGDVDMDIREELLQCEKIRADIEPYEERILTDPNRGHWDLWRHQSKTDLTVEIEDKLIARNPECDVNENGVIAIDFGTKSTIVVYQSGIVHSLPMGIGDGNLSKAPTIKRYENPTVMHFVNLHKFLKAYHSKKGRPKTEWNDLTVSHTAMEQFSASSSEEYYEYLHQIKQWAGQREKQFRIQPHEGESIVLPSFLDLGEDDVNPIELYAYYIGLYINNMRKGHGIFLDYYLSFPVTYEVRIREKIVQSFEKGLKKSLPEAILDNPEIMKNFQVHGDISEPAAYAVCALQEYGFEPEEGEEIFYGIFDFGGGTTDFDFGLWKQSSKRRYDYAVENFGAGGDEFLGGENLLEMLAFEVFKKNQDFMRDKGYTFTLAPKCKEFLGSDALLSDSQEAEKNMHNLMEVLRPYWENGSVEEKKENRTNTWFDDYVNDFLFKYSKSAFLYEIETEVNDIKEAYDKGEIGLDQALANIAAIQAENNITDDFSRGQGKKHIQLIVTLFDKDGNDHVNETLEFSQEEIDQFIEDKIREGVQNFFSALLLSYQNEKVKKPAVVNILLAGNSCKSPVVRKVFEEEINRRQNEIKEKYNIDGSVGKLFEIFPPLGTEEAYQKMEERGLVFERDNFEKPTGKTGVAFGLLQCRKGGTIERITSFGTNTEIPFRFFIGWCSKKKFVLFRDDARATKYKGKPDYFVWYKFIEADDEIFDLYYTTLPECVNGELMVEGNAAVKRHRCKVDVIDENAFVYIRAVDPHTIEYVTAQNDDVDHSMLGEICRKELE